MGSGEAPRALFPLTVRCLSIHADYACRHSGACCRAGWRIPIADDLRGHLLAAGAQGRLSIRTPLLSTIDTSPCQFYAPDAHLCAIHRDLGAGYKPPSCRHFPRVALLDGRGVSLTLSHFCPTAAAMLFRRDVELRVVENPRSFPSTDEYEGLDAREVMPPLLRPGLLWDLDGYSAWEEHAVGHLGRTKLAPGPALAYLRDIAARIEEWSPGPAGPLRAHVSRVFDRSSEPQEADARSAAWGEHADVVKRYLAARLFASWVPYRADRLTALIDDVSRTLDLLKEQAARKPLLDAIRDTDLRVVHQE